MELQRGAGADAREVDRRIAIVGMACHFPGARGPERFWRNLEQGVESVTRFTEAELLASGLDPATIRDPSYVPVGSVIDGVEWFDADLFGYTPREAEVKSPQQRLLLEAVHEALEDAACDSRRYPGRIGLYAGTNLNSYEWLNLLSNAAIVGAIGEAAVQIANDADYLTTSVSYKLGLRGPSVNLQTACSTSLVAVHLAVQALRLGECEMAVAGGVSVRMPIVPGIGLREGYLHSPGGIWSSDGHTRTFDARADGTVFGSGVGVVVLKRLADAIADGDRIRALVLGTAVNNDGTAKVGYTAPSAAGQARAVSGALEDARVGPESIGYVEAHGTATAIGDPIEVAGLTQAFREHTRATGFCSIGSVKSNIGHLSAAAGVAGLIKAALCLEHGLIPPTLNFRTPNARIDFASSPFTVAAAPAAWPASARPRRAGVSSFGIGGTNAHLILEEAPAPTPSGPSRPWLLLPVSARTPAALEKSVDRLGAHLQDRADLDLADAAYTLQVGRARLEQRCCVVCREPDDAAGTLASRDPRRFLSAPGEVHDAEVAFLFPGQGAQHPRMGMALCGAEPVFRAEMDRCLDLFDAELRAALEDGADLDPTSLAQPALFALEHSLARLWMHWGLRPAAMIGHSVGEYVAATLAGVISLEDAARLVALRGRLMAALPPGVMLAVPLPEPELLPLLGPALDLAAVNAPRLCVASGPEPEIARLERLLAERGTEGTRLRTSHAFHSAMMEPVLEEFAAAVRAIELRPPAIAFVSNVTGTWITERDATDADYWARHLRSTVRFAAGLSELLATPAALLEVGPGHALTALARQQPAAAGRTLLASLGTPRSSGDEQGQVLTCLGRLWAAGARVDWERFSAGERRRRVGLPGYPFERRRFWVDQPPRGAAAGPPPDAGGRRPLEDWFHLPVWRQTAPLALSRATLSPRRSRWLLLLDAGGLGRRLAARLADLGQDVVTAEPGAGFARLDDGAYSFAPCSPDGYDALLREAGPADVVVHLLGVTGSAPGAVPPVEGGGSLVEAALEAGFTSLLFLAQALGRTELSDPVRLVVVTDGLFGIGPERPPAPLKAVCLGPCRVIPRELPNVTCQVVDVDAAGQVADRLVAEAVAVPAEAQVALRGAARWTSGFAPVRLAGEEGAGTLRPKGVYLVTGGLGGIGRTVAEHVARSVGGRLVLVGRTRPAAADAWLRELETFGAEVLVVGADVADRAQAAEAVRLAVARFGRIDGVVHAAGVPGGGLIQLKDPEAARAVLAPKVHGTLNLWEALRDQDLDFFVVCSSIIGVLGSYGQVDYCAANAFLDAFASSAGGPALAIGWDGWEQVGMAAAAAGTPLLQELRDGVRREPVEHPLLQARLQGGPGDRTFAARLGPGSSWVLDEHRVAGRAVLPGTAYLEMARAALGDGEGPIEVSDVVFLRPLSVADGGEREVRTVLTGTDAAADFRIESTGAGDAGPTPDQHAAGRVRRLTGRRPAAHDVDAIRGRCSRPRSRTGEGPGLVVGGPRWDTVREIHDGDGESLALIALPEGFEDDLDRFWLHPALLDGATAFGLAGSERQGRFLPLGYGRAVLHRPLPARFHSHLRSASAPDSDVVTCDVTLIGEDGVELASIEGFLLRRVDEASVRETVAARDAADARPAPAGDGGIQPREGVEALLRILAARPGAHLIVTPRSLDAAFARAAGLGQREVEARLRAAAPLAGTGERQASGPYVAPETEAEEFLASLWSGILGIERVGVEDDFFELGGNSLMAVQLVTHVRDRFGIEFGIQHVLERPTVRLLAEVVQEKLVARLESMSDEEVRAMLERSGETG